MDKNSSNKIIIWMADTARYFFVTEPQLNSNEWTLKYKPLFDADPEFWRDRAERQRQFYEDTLRRTIPNVEIVKIPAREGHADDIYVADPFQSFILEILKITDDGSIVIDFDKTRAMTILSKFGLESRASEVENFYQALLKALEEGRVPASIYDGRVKREIYQAKEIREGAGNQLAAPMYGKVLISNAGGRYSPESAAEIEAATGLRGDPVDLDGKYYHVDTAVAYLSGGHIMVLKSALHGEGADEQAALEKFLKNTFPDGKGGIDNKRKEKYLIEIPEELKESFIPNTSCIGTNLYMPYNEPAGRFILQYKKKLEAEQDNALDVKTFYDQHGQIISRLENLFTERFFTEGNVPEIRLKKDISEEAITNELKEIFGMRDFPEHNGDEVINYLNKEDIRKMVVEQKAYIKFIEEELKPRGYHINLMSMDASILGGGGPHCTFNVDLQKIYPNLEEVFKLRAEFHKKQAAEAPGRAKIARQEIERDEDANWWLNSVTKNTILGQPSRSGR